MFLLFFIFSCVYIQKRDRQTQCTSAHTCCGVHTNVLWCAHKCAVVYICRSKYGFWGLTLSCFGFWGLDSGVRFGVKSFLCVELPSSRPAVLHCVSLFLHHIFPRNTNIFTYPTAPLLNSYMKLDNPYSSYGSCSSNVSPKLMCCI